MSSYILHFINLYSCLYELLNKHCLCLYYHCSVDKIWLYGNSVGNIWSWQSGKSCYLDNGLPVIAVPGQQNTFLINISIAPPCQNPMKAMWTKLNLIMKPDFEIVRKDGQRRPDFLSPLSIILRYLHGVKV